MPRLLTILFLADSHLGFDLPTATRVVRRRRGHDFLANYLAALKPALDGEVDLVVHGGDVFDRPNAIASLAYQAFEPLRRIADLGVPVFIVPGNHERSRLPHLPLADHPGIHIFDRPRTFLAEVGGTTVALAGFPYHRRDVRTSLPSLLDASGWHPDQAAVHLLCLHHCVEGATVGPADYTFRRAPDVIHPREVPSRFAAVLSGHIHRHQVLTKDLAGRPLNAPILYPGSIERTSLAEIDEPKGYLMLRFDPAAPRGALEWEFRRLYARPMIRRVVSADGLTPVALEAKIRDVIAAAPEDAVLSVRVTGALSPQHWRRITAVRLRRASPATMNIEVRPEGRFERRQLPTRSSTPLPDQLALDTTS